MPFIKSIRGNYNTSKTDVEKRFEITGGDRVYTAGGFRIHEFITPGHHEFMVRDRYAGSGSTMNLASAFVNATGYMWGAGGGGAAPQGWAYGAPGGAGGFAQGTVTVNSGATLNVTVGGAGGGAGNQNSPAGGGGNGTSWGNGTGGGLSGMFVNNSYAFGNAALLSGGGGGGGSSRAGTSNNGGAGGGSSGENGYAPYQGAPGYAGTQSGGGAGNGGGNNGGQLQGGSVSPHGGGGGGGYYGGGGGGYYEPNGMNGGGGGSGYGGGASGITLTTGSATSVPNTGNSYYGGSAGVPGGISAGGNNGRVVIVYPN